MAVAHILKQKGSTIYTVKPDDSVQTVVDSLAQHHLDACRVIVASESVRSAAKRWQIEVPELC